MPQKEKKPLMRVSPLVSQYFSVPLMHINRLEKSRRFRTTNPSRGKGRVHRCPCCVPLPVPASNKFPPARTVTAVACRRSSDSS